MERMILEKDYIQKLYMEDGLSLKKIGKMMGYSDKTIKKFMEENNIPVQRRNCSELPDEVKSEIELLYSQGLNPRKIGEKFNLSASKVKSYLVHNNLWENKPAIEKTELKYMYNVEKLSMREIAERNNCSLKKVQNAMKENHVKKTKYSFNEKELRLLYGKYHFSMAYIARMKNTTPHFVKKALKKYDIA